ncbi:hypothetical protein H2203_003328 [Taxawa tesnikishii (nom. ined.)]|nr:hypothetical protein H2203_003328 [Dothideales sp. JES 119]
MLRIWEVTRATSAAPFYFKMLEAVVEDNDRTLKERVYKDGGIRENNPSHAAWVEFQSLYEGMRENPALLLSIGTGRADQSQDGFATSWPGPFRYFGLVRRMIENLAVIRSLLVKYTESEHTHVFMRDHAKGEHTWYKRLNVTTGLEDMPLDHWVSGLYQDSKTDVPGGATLTRMEVETAKYLDRAFDPELDDYAAPRVMLRQAAEKLVRQRRARAKEGGLRWQTFIGKAPLHVSVNGFAA